MENKIIGEFNRNTGLVITTDEGNLVAFIMPPKETQYTSKQVDEDITERVVQAIKEHECGESVKFIDNFNTGYGFRKIKFSCEINQGDDIEGEETDLRSYFIEPTTIY